MVPKVVGGNITVLLRLKWRREVSPVKHQLPGLIANPSLTATASPQTHVAPQLPLRREHFNSGLLGPIIRMMVICPQLQTDHPPC